MPWRFDQASHVGGRREQQDRVGVFSVREEERHLIVVADGMGGHRDGAVAADTVLATAERAFASGGQQAPQELLSDLCAAAHRSVKALGPGGGKSPGSTCVLLYLCGAEAYWAHIGDSRLYHFRDGHTQFATVDHSLQELMKVHGDGAAGDPGANALRHRLYMRLGGAREPEATFGSTMVLPGDLFLLCSDGFWASVSPAETTSLMGDGAFPEGSAHSLVALARMRGGKRGDNIGLALAQWRPERSLLRPLFQQFLSRLKRRRRASPSRAAMTP